MVREKRKQKKSVENKKNDNNESKHKKKNQDFFLWWFFLNQNKEIETKRNKIFFQRHWKKKNGKMFLKIMHEKKIKKNGKKQGFLWKRITLKE